MTNSTPTTELKFAPWPTKDDAWYCVIIDNSEAGYVWGSPADAQKYQDMLGDCHNSEYNYPTLDLVEEPALLAHLNSEDRGDQSLIEHEIEYLQRRIDDRLLMGLSSFKTPPPFGGGLTGLGIDIGHLL